MPWWAVVYISMYATFCVAVAVIDYRGRREPVWHIATDVVTSGVLLVLAAAWWNEGWVTPLGRWAGLLMLTTLAWDIYSTSRDIATIGDPTLSPRANAGLQWASIVVTACVMAPAYGLAVGSIIQAWTPS